MLESAIHGVILALHNIALVGCAAAPFYNRNLVNTRAQYGPKLYYELDKVIEETLQGNAPYCMAFIATLIITGVGMPLNHWSSSRSVRAGRPSARPASSSRSACWCSAHSWDSRCNDYKEG